MLWLLVALLGPAHAARVHSFEGGLAPYASFPWGGADVAVDPTVARTGSSSASILVRPAGASDYSSIKLTLTPIRAGETYEARAWCRTRHAADVGGYVVIEFMRGDERVGMAQGPITGPGDNDWTELMVRGVVPEGCDSISLALVAHGAGNVWFDDVSITRIHRAPRPFHGDFVTLTRRAPRPAQPFLGFGAQGDFQLSRAFNRARGVTEADMRLVRSRVTQMRPHIVRCFLDYAWWEPEEGRQTPDSEAMRDLTEWIRFLGSIDCRVLLTPWGDRFAYPEWMGPGHGRMPERADAMVRSLVDCLEHLIRVEGLENVRYACLMNEPDNDPTRAVSLDEYVRLSRLLDSLLSERDLREGLTLLTGDDSWGDPVNASDWFAGVVGAGLDYADAASTHTYRHEYVPALAPWIAARRKLLRRANPKRPRPLLITEFGYGGETYENSANEEYEYGLFLADFAVTALREGASGALMWCLFDTCYSDSDVHCQKWGLWRFRDQGWEPRPGYYTWSLITRFTRPGSEIIRMGREPSAPDLRAVALRSPDGALTVLIVNRYDRPISVVMDVEGRFRLYEYTPSTPLTGEMLQASRHVNLPGSVVVPRRSFLMLTDLR